MKKYIFKHLYYLICTVNIFQYHRDIIQDLILLQIKPWMLPTVQDGNLARMEYFFRLMHVQSCLKKFSL